jgi:hypothetical protein
MSYLLGLGDASGSSAGLAYAQLMGGSLGQPPVMVHAAKTFPPLPAVPLPPEDEPADEGAPPNDDEPADDVPPNDDEPADGAPPNEVEPADEDAPPEDVPADEDAPPNDDAPDVETEDEPADVEPEAEAPDAPESLPELPFVVLQAATTGVTASAKAQALDENRISRSPRGWRRRCAGRA